MKRVGIREFKDRLTSLIAAEEALVVERRGQPVGFYVPIKAKDKTCPEAEESVSRLDALINEVLARTGLSEDEFVAEIMKDWEHHQATDAARR